MNTITSPENDVQAEIVYTAPNGVHVVISPGLTDEKNTVYDLRDPQGNYLGGQIYFDMEETKKIADHWKGF